MTTLETKFLQNYLKERDLLNTFRLNVINFGFSRWVSVEHYFLSVKDPINAIKFAFPFSEEALYGKRTDWMKLHYEYIVDLLGKKASPNYQRFAQYYTAGEAMQLLKYLDDGIQVKDPSNIKYATEIKVQDLMAISDIRRQRLMDEANKKLEEETKKKREKIEKTYAPPSPKPSPISKSDDDYEFIDFSNVKASKKIDGRRLRFYSHNSKYCCILSPTISGEIRERKLGFLRLRVDKLTNELHFVFTKDTGLPFNLDTVKSSLEINNKDMYLFLSKRYNKNSGDSIELSENKANSKDFATYKIISK